MTRDQVKAIMPIMTAFVEGKRIEVLGRNHEWSGEKTDELTFELDPSRYRIAADPTLRPFAFPEEALPYVGRIVVQMEGDEVVLAGPLTIKRHSVRWLHIEGVYFAAYEATEKLAWADEPNKGQPVGIVESDKAY